SEMSDRLGQTHVRLQQKYRGLRVVGGELIVHLKGERIIGVNGRFIPDIGMDTTPAIPAENAVETALLELSALEPRELSSSELVVFEDKDKIPHLAWSQLICYVETDGTFQIDRIFADAQTGRLLGRHPQIMSAKDRRIYDGGGQCYAGSLTP